MPGPPVLDGVPSGTVPANSLVKLRCRSKGTSPAVRLVWYNRGTVVDDSFFFSDTEAVNDYEFYARGDLTDLYCQLEFPPLGLKMKEYPTLKVLNLPGPPEISGNPSSPVSAGTNVRLVCRSFGTEPNTVLVWYRDGRLVDSTFNITGDYVVNEYQFPISQEVSSMQLECRLEFPPAGLKLNRTVVISSQEIPEPPVIDGIPVKPVSPGSPVRLVCRSKGTSAQTRLVWYQDGRPVDTTYNVAGGNLVNEYVVDTSDKRNKTLECRLDFPPVDLRLSDVAYISVHEPLLNVSEWSQWTGCSQTCGSGVRSRSRTCFSNDDNKPCSMPLAERVECIERACSSGCFLLSELADIAFLLDTSNSVYELDFDKMKVFLSDFIDLFNISSNKHRVAALTFSDNVSVHFYLNENLSNKEVKEALLSTPMTLGGTHTELALRFARTDVFSEFYGARTNSAKIAFIITDGRSYDTGLTAAEAEMARNSGIILYSIGIGPEVDYIELEQIAGDRSRAYHINSYDDMLELKKKIGNDLSKCHNPQAPIDGGFGSWSAYSPCSVTCGNGMKTRTRRCDSPAPRNGGKPCEGALVRSSRCKVAECFANDNGRGGWTEWEFTSSCSVTCGEGLQQVSRVCQYEEGCRLGEVEMKTVSCRLTSCAVSTPDVCGGQDGLNVMFASQGINGNGQHSYDVVSFIKNITRQIPVDGQRIRTSLTLGDCVCGRNRGYDLSHYRSYEEVFLHLDSLDLGDVASLLKKVRVSNQIIPNLNSIVKRDQRKQVVVYFLDTNDVISYQALEESKKLRLAGAKVFFVVMDSNISLDKVSRLVSSPGKDHLLVVNKDQTNLQAIESSLRTAICRHA